jgi:hypothetical protein
MVNIAFQSVFCLEMHQNNIFDTSTLRRFKNNKKKFKAKKFKDFQKLIQLQSQTPRIVIIIKKKHKTKVQISHDCLPN